MGTVSQQNDAVRESQFEAAVQIGKGLRFIDRNGIVTINDGRLTLRKHSSEVIVDAPIGDVSVEKARFSAGAAVRISVGCDRYAIEPSRVTRFCVGDTLVAMTDLGGDISRVRRGRELTNAILALIEAQGGHVRDD